MSIWFIFLLSSLSTYRLSLMFAKEQGPGRIFAKLRKLPPARSSAREGLSCQWCESIWWAAIITGGLVWQHRVEYEIAPLFWLACSAVALSCNQKFTKD